MQLAENVTWARRLADDEMETIHQAIVEAAEVVEATKSGRWGDVSAAGLVAFYTIALPDLGTTWEEIENLRAQSFRLPSDQWMQIGEWLTIAQVGVVGVNLLLDWMNKGPSGGES